MPREPAQSSQSRSARRVVVTGSRGLIGSALCAALEAAGFSVTRFDIRDSAVADVTVFEAVKDAVDGAAGVVHLAAVSRVVWGEQNPELCLRTNVGGTRNVLRAAMGNGSPTWVLFASSREVYGDSASLPVREDAGLQPTSIYAHSKASGERLVAEASASGLPTAIVRLSSVYGSTGDHADRVVPAFVRGALSDGVIRVEGRDHLYDFVYIADAVEGIMRLISQLQGRSGTLETVHLVTGVGTSLGHLAEMAIAEGGGGTAVEAPPRSYGARRFVGDPERARRMLGWTASVGIAEGIARLTTDLRRCGCRAEG